MTVGLQMEQARLASLVSAFPHNLTDFLVMRWSSSYLKVTLFSALV